MISLEHVNKYFGEHHVLKDITLNVNKEKKLSLSDPLALAKVH